MRASQEIAPLDGLPDLSGIARAARVKEHVSRDGASFSVRSCKVRCTVTHTIGGRNCGDDGVRELKGKDIERRYLRGAETTRDHTGTIPGAEKAHGVAVYARVASADLAGRVIGFTRPAYTRCPNHYLYAPFHLRSLQVYTRVIATSLL